MGEYISWHVERCLKAASVGVPVSRARLGAFTPPAVMARMQERGSINRHLVSAELVRDIIDSIAGARLSRAVRKGVPGPELDKLMQELSGTGGVHGESDGRKVPAEGQSGRPGLGRVTGAVLRDMLDRLRELAGHNPRSRTISVIVDPGARAITGYLCKDGQPYVVCPEERRALQEIWRAPRLRARGMPKTSEWPQPAPLCTTATVMIHAWRRAHIMPWDTMAALQSLYDGTWSGNRKTADEPLDPIDIEWPAGGHPPILPTDRAVPPERMDGQLKPEQKCVYKLAWDFQRIAEWKVLRMRHTVLDCDVISRRPGSRRAHGAHRRPGLAGPYRRTGRYRLWPAGGNTTVLRGHRRGLDDARRLRRQGSTGIYQGYRIWRWRLNAGVAAEGI